MPVKKFLFFIKCEFQAPSCHRPRSSMTLMTPVRSWSLQMLLAWASTCKHHHAELMPLPPKVLLLHKQNYIVGPCSKNMLVAVKLFHCYYSMVISHWHLRLICLQDYMSGQSNVRNLCYVHKILNKMQFIQCLLPFFPIFSGV